MHRIVPVGGLVAALLAVVAPTAAATGYAPVDRPGPPLGVAAATLASSLACSPDLAAAGREAVLLVPGTGIAPAEEFYGHARAFADLGIPYCTIATPSFATADIQVSAEYVVYAVRTVSAATGRKVDLLGGSQGGGPALRWPLRFWPDVRSLVDDAIGLAPTNHGTAVLRYVCAFGTVCANALCPASCVPALWQQADNSRFTAALNSHRKTFAGISYSAIYSRTDEFVQPNLDDSGTSSLRGGEGDVANVALQDVCPLHVADHLQTAVWDPISWALTLDALTHAGPADPARIDRAVCARLTMPYTDAVEAHARFAGSVVTIFGDRFLTQPRTASEPALRAYVTAP